MTGIGKEGSTPGDPLFSDEPEVRFMDQSAYEHMPTSFAEYAATHPGVLPDYSRFAHTVMDMVGRGRPKEIIALTGPNDIGKTSLLVPAILRTARRQGYNAVGYHTFSFGSIGSTITEVTLNEQEKQFYMDNITERDIRVVGRLTQKGHVRDGRLNRKIFELTGRLHPQNTEAIKRSIAQHFKEGGDRKLCVLDEFAAFSSAIPNLLPFISELAERYGVKLVALSPLTDIEGADPESFEVSNINTRKTRIHRSLNRATDLSITPVAVPEQRVPMEAIPEVLDTFGIDQEVMAVFQRNKHLRRLGIFEKIVDEFASRKHKWPDDLTVLNHFDVQTLGVGLGMDDPLRHNGLTEDVYRKMIDDLLRDIE